MMEEQQIQPFDWHRILIGDQPPLFLLEILLRVGVMFGWTILLLRFIGKRGHQQVTPLEYIVIIALGSATGDPMFYADVPLLYGMVSIAAIVAATEILTWLKLRFDWLDTFTESSPVVLMEDGQLIRRVMKQERLTEKELHAMLRRQGITDYGQVRLAILEVTGELSIFRQDAKRVVQIKSLISKPE